MKFYAGKHPQNTCLYQMYGRAVLIRQMLPNLVSLNDVPV